LWRYTDLQKLIDLAQTSQLHFTRTDKFSDPFEGLMYKHLADRFFASKSNMTNPTIDEETRIAHNKRNKNLKLMYGKLLVDKELSLSIAG